MKVNQQPHAEIKQPQMRQNLGKADRMQCFFAFDLDYDLVVDEQVRAKTALQFDPVVDDWNRLLASNAKSDLFEFVSQTAFVCRLEQTGS